MSALIPCHIIAGMLGTGKTTAILDFLHRRRHHEFTAVLVNDFGPNGIDSAILAQTESSPEVVNLSGGCLCCTSTAHFKQAFSKIITQPGIDRIIIEPSGIVLLDELLKTMEELAREFPAELRPVILMTEPSSFNRQRKRGIQYGTRLAEQADVIAANFSDSSDPDELAEFMKWANATMPREQEVISTRFGRLPDRLFEAGRSRNTPKPFSGPGRTVDHEYVSGGLQLSPNLTFNPKHLFAAAQQLAESGTDGAEIIRFKGIFQTRENPVLFEIARGRVFRKELASIVGNRMDWITDIPVSEASVRKQFQQE